MIYDSLNQPNYIFEYIRPMSYPAIRNFCSTNKQIYQICRENPLIVNLINIKRIEYKTDLHLQKHPAHNVMKTGDVEIIDELIKRGFYPSDHYNLAIIWASDYNHLNVVNRLLQDSRVNPSDQNNMALIMASGHGYLDIVNRLLQDSRVDPGDQNNRAIFAASGYGHLNIVRRLLRESRVVRTLLPADLQTIVNNLVSHS